MEDVKLITRTVLDFIKTFNVELVEVESGKVLVVNNLKGGVGKTMVSTLLAHFLSMCGFRVLLVDSDSLGSASKRFVPMDEIEEANKTSNIFRGKPVQPYAVSDTLDVLVGTNDLEEVETEISLQQKKMKLFRSWKFKNKLSELYDFIIVDTHNNKGWINQAMYYSADYVLGVTEPSVDSFTGILDLEDFLVDFEEDNIDEETGVKKVDFTYKFVFNKVPQNKNITTKTAFVRENEADERYLGSFQDRNIFDEAPLFGSSIFDLTEEKKYNRTDTSYREFFIETMELLKVIALDVLAN